MSQGNSSFATIIALGCILGSLLIAVVQGFSEGSILGAVVAGFGVVPACWGIWQGMQAKTQTQLFGPVLLLFVSIGLCGLLILLRFVDWLR